MVSLDENVGSVKHRNMQQKSIFTRKLITYCWDSLHTPSRKEGSHPLTLIHWSLKLWTDTLLPQWLLLQHTSHLEKNKIKTEYDFWRYKTIDSMCLFFSPTFNRFTDIIQGNPLRCVLLSFLQQVTNDRYTFIILWGGPGQVDTCFRGTFHFWSSRWTRENWRNICYSLVFY